MHYAIVSTAADGSQSADQITTIKDIVWDSTHQCPASALTPQERAMFKVVELYETPRPEYAPATQECMRDGCVYNVVRGRWEFYWRISQGVPPKPVPEEVTIRQAQLALYAVGVLVSIDQYIDAIVDADERAVARIEWNKATAVRRDWWLTIRMGTALGLTPVQLDDMFRYAVSL